MCEYILKYMYMCVVEVMIIRRPARESVLDLLQYPYYPFNHSITVIYLLPILVSIGVLYLYINNMSFFKSMWKSSSKHHKLEPGEEKCLAKEDQGLEGEPSSIMPDALSFTVKYLGSTIVSNNTTATAAVDTILTMAKVAKRKKYQVTVMVTLNGVMVSDPKTGSLIFDASIYRISNVSTDPVRRNIFTFFATNKYDITECHAFQCPKRKMAQTVTLTVAHSFKTAYEVWQRGHQMCTKIMEQKAETEKIQNEKNIDIQLIDLSERNEVSSDVSNNWVRFETDKEENSEELTYNRHIQLLQPPEKSKTGNSTKITSEFGNFADNFIWTNNLQ